MYLAEAHSRLVELGKLLKGLAGSVTRVSPKGMPSMFERSSALLEEYEDLRRRVDETEYTTRLGGTRLSCIKHIISSLDYRLEFFSSMSGRNDLPDDVMVVIADNLKKFQFTKDTLLAKYEEALWEIELLG